MNLRLCYKFRIYYMHAHIRDTYTVRGLRIQSMCLVCPISTNLESRSVCVSDTQHMCVLDSTRCVHGVCVRVCVWYVPFLRGSSHGVCVSRIHKIQPIAFGV